MSVFKISNCPVCSSHNWKSFLTCSDFFVSGDIFEIQECSECGFKITANAADEENFEKYYQSDKYISHSNTSKGIINTVYHKVRNYMLGHKRRIVEKSIKKKRGEILEIGAGTGFFLNEMKMHGWQISGTEKSQEAIDFAQNKFGIKIHMPDKLFEFENKKFDVISLWHVLEHIHLLDRNMETFFKLLNPSGKLVIALPNHTSYDACHYKEYWAAWDVPRHLWHFGPEHIKSFAKKHGFIFESAHTMPFDSFYVSMLSEKYKKSKFGFIKGLIYGKISWLISLFNKSRSSSLVYVFRK